LVRNGARARRGALDNILFYGTLGLAYGRGQVAAAGVTQNDLRTGVAAGSGREVGLAYNWSAKAAYLYIDLGSDTYRPVVTSNGLINSVARRGVKL
jgi:outer membrane immunogenic protein